MTNALTFLGTGTSQGIPMIACDCPVCTSHDPHNQRTRTSGLITINQRNILIDTTPELRIQCLQNNIRQIDACLVTHTHADHIMGMDDLRRFNQIQRQAIDIHHANIHQESLEKIFGYARGEHFKGTLDIPQLNFTPFTPQNGPFTLFEHTITPLLQPHGRNFSIGYRIGNIAWCTDLSTMPQENIAKLQNLDVLVLGALREKPHPAHLSLDQAIELAQIINAKKTYFVHMSHHVSHQDEKKFPPNIHLAYDTLKINLP